MTITIKPDTIISEAAVPQPQLRGTGPTTWTIAIDWERNGSFADTYDDVTDRVISAQWFLGFRQPYQDAADNSALALTLKNHDRQYSPEYTNSPLFGRVVPFRPARIQSSDGLVTRTHWQGWAESFQPAVNRYGQRVVQIVATGPMQFLKAAETVIELQENKRSDEIIAELIQEVVFPPALASAWVVGRTGHSEVGVTTFLADVGIFSDLDIGALALEMAGDNWVRQGGLSDTKQNTFNVYHAIRDVAAGERGRFLFDREGKALFWNRHHLLHSDVEKALFDDTMNDMAYIYAGLEHMKNEVIVTCHPRDISDSDQDELWTLPAGSVINVSPDEPRTLFVKYEDENGKRVGAKDVTVGDLEFEKGAATATVEAKATGAELTFTNTGSKLAVITQCIVRGRKIVDSGSMEAKATDASSIVDYGRRTLRLNLPMIDNLEAAEQIAKREKNRRGQPGGAVSTIKAVSHGKLGGRQHQRQLALTVGDKLAIAEGQTGHDSEHYIIGESHKLSAGATLFESTWYLEAAPATYPWKLGAEGLSELSNTTVLAY
ncbi:MAG: hypothetical protein K8S97_16320 [Anaerolineae bacterium]|nr:hypothetical protein [Anaerolineae bacterium]